MSINHIIGIDVSKSTFDVSLCSIKDFEDCQHRSFKNTKKGINQLLLWLSELNVEVDTLLICLENTGIYHRLLVKLLQVQNIFIWLENAVQIKWSIGINRGKNDKIDAKRIMKYAYRNIDKAKRYEPRSNALNQIADYLAVRSRIMNCIKSLKTPIKELRAVGLVEESELMEKTISQSLEALKTELKKINELILDAITSDKELERLYELCTSVKSIGFVAASYLIVYTNGFTRFKSAKQLASYAGVAPFEYSSGTSVKGKTRVHHMANKTLKQVMHMSAVSSLRFNEEMKSYFTRKVGEGKNKMLVLNAIRNKLLARVFSCVKNQRMYEVKIIV